uniref:Uncharacterized protein n=1 Tax=Arundo donax TaxID=35708 RepID=A0A0A9DUL6_ARUDO
MVLSLMDSQFITVPTKKQPRPDSDEDPEELQRSIDEYLDAHPCGSLREAFDSIIAVERATLAALAAKRGTEPRVHSALVAEPPMEPFPVDQDSMASGKPR